MTSQGAHISSSEASGKGETSRRKGRTPPLMNAFNKLEELRLAGVFQV